MATKEATKRAKKSEVVPPPVTQEQKRIQDIAVLTRLSISIWRAQRTDKRITQEVADSRHNSKHMGKYNKFLIGEAVLSAIEGAAAEAYITHRQLTLPWTDEGFRILSAAGYLTYKQRMESCRDKYWAGVKDFLPKYSDHKKEAKEILNGDYNELEYPDLQHIGEKFGFRLNIGPVPSYEDWRVEIGEAEVRRLRQEGKGFLEEQLKTSTKDIWSRLHKVVTKMVERLKIYEVDSTGKRHHSFQDTLVTNIAELLELIPILNVTKDPEVDAFALRIQNELTQHQPEILRSDEKKRKEVEKRAQEIAQKMQQFV